MLKNTRNFEQDTSEMPAQKEKSTYQIVAISFSEDRGVAERTFRNQAFDGEHNVVTLYRIVSGQAHLLREMRINYVVDEEIDQSRVDS